MLASNITILRRGKQPLWSTHPFVVLSFFFLLQKCAEETLHFDFMVQFWSICLLRVKLLKNILFGFFSIIALSKQIDKNQAFSY